MQIIYQILNLYPKVGDNFFDGLSDKQKLIYNDLKGPSWSPNRNKKKIITKKW